ncbi:odorant receptor 13a-like [Pogonomyrmex barbatus]|uniref:Odorant receptor n=1 Tax=Pogonomyrmex barbatus TaxID=144034 RepID=A0A6I9WEK7_9HYME|nr:odorant receptor 13a-like [Pogonomyrmex barbatus]
MIKKDIWQRQYYILKLYLTISGTWPYHGLYGRYIRFVLIFTLSFTILIPQLLYFLVFLNLDNVFECLPTIMIGTVFSFKILTIMLNSEKVKICLNTIKEDWLLLNTSIEKDILQRHTKFGQYIATFYAVFMHMTTCLFVLKPVMLTLLAEDVLNVTESTIPFASRLPFHVEYGKRLNQYVYPIAVHCYAAILAHAFATIAIDSLYYTLIQHACGMFSAIGYVLENIGKNSDNNFDLMPDKMKDDNYIKVLNCLRRHLHVIEFAEHIESMYTKIFLLNLNFNMIGGSLAGIQVLMNLDKNMNDIAGPITVYIAQFIHLFLHFWQAQFLLDYSVLPYESICRANWYYTSTRCQKLFLLIMNRTVSPCKITAGKIMVLSIESFAVVVKASLSYLTVFRSLQ